MKIEIGFRQFHSSITCYMSIEFRKYTIVWLWISTVDALYFMNANTALLNFMIATLI
jgi:hypothetical protein